MNRRYISKANVQENDALVWDGLGPFLAYGLKLGYKIPKNLIFAPQFLKIHPSIYTTGKNNNKLCRQKVNAVQFFTLISDFLRA